ncbi:SH3 and multiple ankyrin repeat domains protein 3 isoform X2 [Phlebotomus argentipes]|uniref:SH3 and multiple ankyrin repeat domains protein 3 isoform X2 n=1 Tax=Phlebotomus argentipes TaxID=94469 RepID=UPI0028937C47|nr:SH3 and multiple ankyrin repeat domains protein 3 isoform X2 [Phlebotomus argentipes]
MDPGGYADDDLPPPASPEPRDGWLLVRIHVPELNVSKCLQFPADRLVWNVKQQVLASLPKELKESFNYGLFCPPSNGKAGKFLDEERRLGDYPFNGPVGYLELKYKRRVYKMLNLDEKQLKALHTRANLRRFLECVSGGHVEKISKMCAKGLDPNFHCPETGETPLTMATGAKKPNKLLIALVNGGAILDYRTRDGATALHKAVERDSLEAVSTLLELGASPNYKDIRGMTPVYLSVTKKTDAKICEGLLHDHATLGTQDTQGWQEVHQVAVIAGNLELAEMIQNYKAEDIVPFRGPPRYNPRRRSGVAWGPASAMGRLMGPPSPCPSEHPFSSASSSLSESSSSHRSHEDDISIVTDKSLGDTSDIISDSSGVGTSSDSAACSIGHPSTTVVCMERYVAQQQGHLTIQPGDVIEVVGSTDCGLLEGYVRGTNRSGLFPIHHIQEVNIRQKNITNVSTASQEVNTRQTHFVQDFNATEPRIKKVGLSEPRTVVLHRGKRGFGFILRGAKATSPLMQLKPSERCPALQYLDDVDPDGIADMAGLRPGDFLIAINNEDVRAASHEHVVDLIRNSGALVSMTVISQLLPGQPVPQATQSGFRTPLANRQCATLPRHMSGLIPGHGGKMPAPLPPRRDPKTTLSVGRARAKSMVAGLEGGSTADDDDLTPTAKSSSAESIHQTQSAVSTPTQGGPGTPIQPRTASIKARPTSGRITAAELEELFQRQQGDSTGDARYSAMMTTSRFQSGGDSGTPTPQVSPQKAPLVYSSVADMKRKKSRQGGAGSRVKPCSIPLVNGELRRNFHSTPDLASAGQWPSGSVKGHRSQDDVNVLHNSLQRLNLPPPTHPPPPPPVGQVVKVDVSRSEYESAASLQQKLKLQAAKEAENVEVMSSFRPAANAKLYASPQDIRNVGYRGRGDANRRMTTSIVGPQPVGNQYAQPCRSLSNASQRNQPAPQAASNIPAPPIPDPDYSLSESDGEEDNSVLQARVTIKTNGTAKEAPPTQAESSGNSNTSGSSTGSSSMPHSFSVEEIQKMRTKLKSSKSYPHDLLGGQAAVQQPVAEEGDNSSSGVSSDQEIALSGPEKPKGALPAPLPKPEADAEVRSDDDASPSPPAKGFQRHNSLTRKQAASIAMSRALQTKPAVSLAQLPPPIETESDDPDCAVPPPMHLLHHRHHMHALPHAAPDDSLVLAPPPQFCDSFDVQPQRSVRIVGAVPKAGKIHMQ